MITKALLTDAASIERLVNSAYRGEESRKGWSTEADLLDGTRIDEAGVRELLQKPGTTLLKYVRDDEIIGCVELRLEKNKMYLGMLSVNPVLQAGGIGRQLLQEAESYALREKATVIFMTVLSVRTELIDWYVRRGYELTGERKTFSIKEARHGIAKTTLEFVILQKIISKASPLSDDTGGRSH